MKPPVNDSGAVSCKLRPKQFAPGAVELQPACVFKPACLPLWLVEKAMAAVAHFLCRIGVQKAPRGQSHPCRATKRAHTRWAALQLIGEDPTYGGDVEYQTTSHQ